MGCHTITVIQHITKTLIDHEALLTDLDRAIGDGDHGMNMKRGCMAINAALAADPNAFQELPLSDVINKCAMLLLSNVGGASGPIFATGLMHMAKVLKNQIPIAAIWGDALHQALLGIKDRGKAELNDKTMVDVLEPIDIAFNQAVSETLPLSECILKACDAAETGLQRTKDIQAKKGRASYLGERSIGTLDPGAYSLFLIINALNEALSDPFISGDAS